MARQLANTTLWIVTHAPIYQNERRTKEHK